jgi:hypothetical protein
VSLKTAEHAFGSPILRQKSGRVEYAESLLLPLYKDEIKLYDKRLLGEIQVALGNHYAKAETMLRRSEISLKRKKFLLPPPTCITTLP